MVEYSRRLSATFGALAAPVRLALLDELRNGSRTVLELAEPFDVSLNAVSKHLKVLERAGLVRRDVRGREHHISLAADPLREVRDYAEHFERFWQDRLDALEDFLETRRKRKASRGAAMKDGIDLNNREDDDDTG